MLSERRTAAFTGGAAEHRLQEAVQPPSEEMPKSCLHMLLASWLWAAQLQWEAGLDSVQRPLSTCEM